MVYSRHWAVNLLAFISNYSKIIHRRCHHHHHHHSHRHRYHLFCGKCNSSNQHSMCLCARFFRRLHLFSFFHVPDFILAWAKLHAINFIKNTFTLVYLNRFSYVMAPEWTSAHAFATLFFCTASAGPCVTFSFQLLLLLWCHCILQINTHPFVHIRSLYSLRRCQENSWITRAVAVTIMMLFALAFGH